MSNQPAETPEEKARRLRVPLVPRRVINVPPPYDPNPTVAVCGECGIELKRVMGFVCTKPNCPTTYRSL